MQSQMFKLLTFNVQILYIPEANPVVFTRLLVLKETSNDYGQMMARSNNYIIPFFFFFFLAFLSIAMTTINANKKISSCR